jgi:hypothetical protein
MAILTRAILGNISGSIADLSFRRVHGKTFIVAKPASYTTPVDPDSVCRRIVFSFACKLASVINALTQLKPFWQNAAARNSTAFHTIMKSNFRNVTADSVTENTILTPITGFNLRLISQSFTSTTVQITIAPIGTAIDIDPALETQLRLVAVLSLCNPIDPKAEPFLLASLVSEVQPLALDTALNFSLSFDNTQTQRFTQYNIHQALLALVTIKDDSTPVQYSATVLLKD